MKKLLTSFKILFLLGLIVYFIFFVYNAYASMMYPYHITYADGIGLDRIQKLSQGINVYHELSAYPYVPCQYPLVAWLLLTGLAKVFGTSLAIGRVYSFITSILVGVLIYKIVKTQTKDKYISIVSSLIFFASPFTYLQASVFGDIMATGIIFSLIGVCLVLKYQNSKMIFFCIPFFLLAGYTKQVFIAAPIASVIYLLFKNKRLSLQIGSLYVIFGTSIFLLINYLTNGQFYFHVVSSNQAYPFSLFTLIYHLVLTIQTHLVLFALATAFAMYLIYKRENNIFVIYLIILIPMMITLGKAGSSPISYMLETIAISCILFGSFFSRVIQCKKDKILPVLVGLLLILQLVTFVHAPHVIDNMYMRSTTPTENNKNVTQEVSLYINNASGKMLSEDMGILVINNKELLVDIAAITHLHREGISMQGEIVSDINNRNFSLILLRFDVNTTNHYHSVTDEMLVGVRNNYHLEKCIGLNYIYLPNNT